MRATYGEHSRFTERYLHWQYVENPDGAALGFDAYAGAELAAHYVTLPFAAEIFGRPARGLLSLNTATHPDHQGKGLFTRLATATYARAREDGYDFVAGVANANSTPGFVKKLGFSLISPLDARIGVGFPVYEATAGLQFRHIWTPATRQWRLENPVQGYAFGGGAVWANPAVPFVKMCLTTMFPDLPPRAAGARTQPLTSWIGLAPNLRWRGLSWTIPERLRPAPLNFIFRGLTDSQAIPACSGVLFEAIDFDAY